jgi:hypothetical protein
MLTPLKLPEFRKSSLGMMTYLQELVASARVKKAGDSRVINKAILRRKTKKVK